MANDKIEVQTFLAATPDRIYSAWLSSKEHSAFTGAEASVEPTLYGRYSSWDGYIEGVNLELDPGRRIVQTWRSTDFPAGSPDSRLEVLFESTGAGTRLTLLHSDIPEGHGEKVEAGWKEFYLRPMLSYFGGGKKTAKKTKVKAKSTKTAAKKSKAGKKKTTPKKAVKAAKSKNAKKKVVKKNKAKAKNKR